MDDSTHRFFTWVLYIALIAGAVLLWFNEQKFPALALYAVFAAVALWFHRRYYTPEYKDPRGKFFLAAELLLALCIQYFDSTGFVELYLFIVIGDAFLAYGISFSLVFTAVSLSCYTAMLYMKIAPIGIADFWAEIDATLLACAVYVAVLINARHNIAAGKKNRLLAEDLRKKTEELEGANAELKAYALELEKTADLRAREKLLQELHDKLGHLLTTASVGVQAARVQAGIDPAAARERLDTVTQQLQTAMQSLRDVIRGGETAAENLSGFPESLLGLIGETEKRAGIRIGRSISDSAVGVLSELDAARQTFLYNALMEGLTNGIRHGGAREFQFSLSLEEPYLRFLLRDNGKGFLTLSPGFGLIKMRKNARRLEARVSLTSPGGGELEILLPVRSSAEDSAGLSESQ